MHLHLNTYLPFKSILLTAWCFLFSFKIRDLSYKMFCNVLRSSHKGPSRVPHWKPCTMLSFTEPRRALSTYNTEKKSTDHLSSHSSFNKFSCPVNDLLQKQIDRVTCNHT